MLRLSISFALLVALSGAALACAAAPAPSHDVAMASAGVLDTKVQLVVAPTSIQDAAHFRADLPATLDLRLSTADPRPVSPSAEFVDTYVTRHLLAVAAQGVAARVGRVISS